MKIFIAGFTFVNYFLKACQLYTIKVLKSISKIRPNKHLFVYSNIYIIQWRKPIAENDKKVDFFNPLLSDLGGF